MATKKVEFVATIKIDSRDLIREDLIPLTKAEVKRLILNNLSIDFPKSTVTVY